MLLIGNELLSGRTADRNLQYIGQRLAEHGIRLGEARVVEDEPADIIAALNTLKKRYDTVFTTGGIGPTHDDITADCVAEAFGVALLEHPEARRRIEEYCAEKGVDVNADRLRMARVPEGGELIENPLSAAPGFRIENVYVMAGVPSIMQAMLETVLPTLRAGRPIHSVSVIGNLPEGEMATPLRAIQTAFPAVSIGSYPGRDASGFRGALVARGSDPEELEAVAEELRAMILRAGGKLIEAP